VQNKIDEEANTDEGKEEEKGEVKPADKPSTAILDKTQVEL